MRITILQGAFFPVPPLMGGAVEKIWSEMGRQFAAKEHCVTHVSRSYSKLPIREMLDGVRHIRVAGFDTPASPVVLKMRDLLYTLRARKILPEADVVVTHTFWAPLLLRHKQGRVYVSVERFPKGQMKLYSRAARLRVPSSAVRDAVLLEIGQNDSGRVSLIPNPLPFTPQSGSERLFGQKKNIILYVGRVHPEKGLKLLIQSLRSSALSRHLEKWTVKIVGPWAAKAGGGGDDYHRELQRLAEGMPVHFTGPVNDEDKLREFYQEASIFVYPSVAGKGESFGLAPLEAMAYACVPVVSDLQCFKDFIRHGENGLNFDHQASDAGERLAGAVVQLLQDPELRQQMGQAALRVNKSHSAAGIAEDFITDFMHCIK